MNLYGPQITFNSAGGGSSGGSSSSSSSSPRPKARPKPKPAPKPASKPASSGGGKGSKPAKSSSSSKLDNDMTAGSKYTVDKKTGTVSSPTSVTAKDLKSGNVTKVKSSTGSGSTTVKKGTPAAAVPKVNIPVAPTKAKPAGRDLDADMIAGSTYTKDKTTGVISSPTSVTAKDLKSGNVTTYPSKTGTGSVTVKKGTTPENVPKVNIPVPSSKPKGRDLDLDMIAGSTYTKDKTTGVISSPTSVTAKDLKSGNVTTYPAKNGTGSVTVKKGTKLEDVPTVNVGVNGNATKSNEDVYSSTPVTAPVAPVTSSPAPVTAPETIAPADGVGGGGGRDGGASAKRKASKTNEDKLKIKRKSEGVKGYKTSKNPMSIKREKS